MMMMMMIWKELGIRRFLIDVLSRYLSVDTGEYHEIPLDVQA
jgi:hypothetical protein